MSYKPFMGQNIAIDFLRKEEFEEAVSLSCRAFDDSYDAPAREELTWGPPPHKDATATFAARIGGCLAGIIQTLQNPVHFDVYSISWVAVDPAQQGKGIGGALVRYAEDYIARIMLEGRPGTILIVDDTRLKNPHLNYYGRLGYADGPLLTHRGMQVMVKTVNTLIF
jgi:ribosomal protein S18 acetylase RimI-like enzyme